MAHQVNLGRREDGFLEYRQGDVVNPARDHLQKFWVVGSNTGGIVETGNCSDRLGFGVGCGVGTGIVLFVKLAATFHTQHGSSYLCASAKGNIHRGQAIWTSEPR